MDSLPTEIITHILKFLDPVEIQGASEVCLSWYEASMHPRLVKDIFMGRKTRCNFAKVTYSQYKAESGSLDLMIEGYNKEKDLTWDNNNAQLNLGPEVKQLLLKIDGSISAYLTAIILGDILSHFTCLETLILKDMNMHRGFLVDCRLSAHLQSLRRLKLCFVGSTLNFLQGPTIDLLPNKIHLCLENEVVLTKVEGNSRYNYGKMIPTLTLEDLKIVCGKYPTIFLELNMVNSLLTQEYTEKLCRIINKQMEILRLAKCNYIDDKTLEILSNSTLRLKTLVIDGCKPNECTSFVTTSSIDMVAREMKSLESLSFYLRDKVRFNPDTFISGFIDLTSLSLMSYGEHHEYCTINLHSREFSAAHLCKLDSPVLLSSLAKGSPDLRELSLDLICEISDNEVLYICKVFPNLSLLKLNSVCEVTDKALLGNVQCKLSKREEQRISPPLVDVHTSEENDQGEACQESKRVEQCSQSAQPIKGSISVETNISNSKEESRRDLPQGVTKPDNQVRTQNQTESPRTNIHEKVNWPVYLDIADCRDHNERVSNGRRGSSDKFKSGSLVSYDVKLDDCLNHSPCRTSTTSNYGNMSRGRSILYCHCQCGTDCDSYVTAHRGLRELEYLQTLKLVGCCELTDKGFTLGLQFPNLSHLKLTHCDNLTDSGIAAIVTNNPTIKTFILEFCKLLSDDSVRMVFEGLKNLEKLKFDNCSKLTAACLMYVTLSKTLQEVWFGSCNIPITNIENFKETATTVKYHDFDW